MTHESVLDREAIRDCLARYCRGIDRRDGDLLTGVYWPEATDDHIQYKGSAKGFIEWVLPLLSGMEITQHFLGQSLISLHGELAGVETYFQAYHRMPDGAQPVDVVLGGRYLDRFAKRQGEWKILERRVVADWYQKASSLRAGWSSFGMPSPPPENMGVGGSEDPSGAFFATFGG